MCNIYRFVRYSNYKKQREVSMNLDGRIDFYRKKSKQCDNVGENVMDLYFNIKSNDHIPLKLEKVTLDRIIDKYGKNGLIVISAYKPNVAPEEITYNNQKLIKLIKQSKYLFLPLYRATQNSETGEVRGYEPFFIVFNYDLNANSRDFNEFMDFGLKMCKQYEQDCIQHICWTDIYANPLPCTLNEQQRRDKSGEIMIFK